ncbi:MAG: YbaK/EbsC family protein [Bryobacteraceae bacterium]
MKSSFCKFRDTNGQVQLAIVHCRGDRILNWEKLSAVLGGSAPPERLSTEEISKFGMEYGLVNPFNVAGQPTSIDPYVLDAAFLEAPVQQVFDQDALSPIGTPGTMMTNAGSLSWAIEFFPWDLAKVIHAKIGSITDPDPAASNELWGVRDERRIGIITGNGPESGSALWNIINSQVRTLLGHHFCGDVSMPPVIVSSVPALGLAMELEQRETAIWNALKTAVGEVCQRGICFLAIPDHTTACFAPRVREICLQHGTEFVSIGEATASWLQAKDIRRVALVGVESAAGQTQRSAYHERLQDVQVELMSPRGARMIEKLAYQVKQDGVTEEGLTRLRDLLREEIASEYVVLWLPELSLLFERQRRKGRSGKTLVDPLAIYAEYIARRYLGLPWPSVSR